MSVGVLGFVIKKLTGFCKNVVYSIQNVYYKKYRVQDERNLTRVSKNAHLRLTLAKKIIVKERSVTVTSY